MDWFGKLFLFYVRRKLFRQRIPLLASFKLTYRCNLSCRACPFHHRAGGPGADMSFDIAVKSIDALAARGCLIVMFEGGEPFLWRDGAKGLHDVAAYARTRFMRVGITTNGTFPLDVPDADVLWVSLDGLRDTHNALRSNSFDRVRRNLAQARHPNLFIHITLNRENRHELRQMLDAIREVPTVKGVTIQLFYPYDQGEDRLGLAPSARSRVLQEALQLKKKGYPIMNSAGTLKAMAGNRWVCREDVLINVDPDGTITEGCYAKSRGEIRCGECGFTPVAEASRAFAGKPGAVLAGWRLFIPTAGR
jgi:MoaA/NifB/PqqE/SkfB family radical SAM enzyme